MNLPLAPLAGGLLGAVVAAGVVLLPDWRLELLVMDSGLPAVFSAAAPPLGMTARLAMAGGAGALTAVFVWLGVFVTFGTRGLSFGGATTAPATGEAVPTPVIRRADAHPDAPPRAPLLATRDLGTPFLDVVARTRQTAARAEAPIQRAPEAPPQPMPQPQAIAPVPAPPPAPLPIIRPAPVQAAVPAPAPVPVPVPVHAPVPAPAPVQAAAPRIVLPDERPLPDNLDQPLSAYDPAAIREAPVPLPEAVAALNRPARPAVFDSKERFETFELTPMRRDPPRPRPVPEPRVHAAAKAETEATIHALLERLETGVVRKGIATGMEREPRRRDAERGLEDALVQLRNLARRA